MQNVYYILIIRDFSLKSSGIKGYKSMYEGGAEMEDFLNRNLLRVKSYFSTYFLLLSKHFFERTESFLVPKQMVVTR